MERATSYGGSLRLAAVLLLSGQVLYIVITLFHADGNANDHPAVFAEYAASSSWTLVHIGQFAAMSIMTGGLIAFFYIVDAQDEVASWVSRFGTASAVASLALYGVLQAVDGVANKQADLAWVNGPATEKAARFASAEAVRWIEWGVRSYQDFAFGLALLLFGIAAIKTVWLPKPVAWLMLLTGIVYLVQGWIVGVEGFSQTMSVTIVAGEIVGLVWMVWLVVIAWRPESGRSSRTGADGQ